MNYGTIFWLALFAVLFSHTFGASQTLGLITCIFANIGGFIGLLFYFGGIRLRNFQVDCFWSEDSHESGLAYKNSTKFVNDCITNDHRMTGSTTIDEALREVLDYTVRDYIKTWYRKITDDKQFSQTIRSTLQQVIIRFAGRVKEVDLVPFITTTLVDDFASHIRLYRRSIDKVNEHKRDDTKPPADLESIFFDLELEMEVKMCRDLVCLNEADERQYLTELSELLLYILLPAEDFNNKPFCFMSREIMVEGILLPMINLVTDPDYVNQTIGWLCRDTPMSSEVFLTSLRQTDSIDEVQACKEMVDIDIARQRSKDTGGEDDTVIKQKLSSLLFVKTICEQKIAKLQAGIDNPNSTNVFDMKKFAGQRIYKLDFETVLNNNTALQYFREFLASHSAENYLNFYHTIECYKISAEQQISAALLADNCEEKPDLDMVREAASNIFSQYLSDKSAKRLMLEDHLIKQVFSRIQYEEPSEHVFDEAQCRVWNILQEEKYFPTFRKSQLYFKLLRELNLLTENKMENQTETDTPSDCSSSPQLITKSVNDNKFTNEINEKKNLNYCLYAEITSTGVCRDHGKVYTVYMINVTKTDIDGTVLDTRDVYRRYSDFDRLHSNITLKYNSLKGLALPKKSLTNNTSKEFIEKRKLGLNAYLQTLLRPAVINAHKGIIELLDEFLRDLVLEQNKKETPRSIENFVNPLKSVGALVRSVPDNVVDGVLKVSGGIRNIPNTMIDGVGKMINVKPNSTSPKMEKDKGKVGASLLHLEDEQDNIPLRILLLLLDEVFDLKNKNVWLRRRIDAILRQIIQTMMGDSINRKILDHVELYTSSDQVAEYIKAMRDAKWPNGYLAENRLPRDEQTKERTKVVCRAKMLAIVSEELRHLIGTEAIHHGVNLLFSMFQHQTLNKRLFYVCLEAALVTLFPHHKFQDVFQKLHSTSPRMCSSKNRKNSKSR